MRAGYTGASRLSGVGQPVDKYGWEQSAKSKQRLIARLTEEVAGLKAALKNTRAMLAKMECPHGHRMTDHCEPCGRVHGGGP